MRAQWSSGNGSSHVTRSDERERALLAGVARRDRSDFEALYKLYHRPLERFLLLNGLDRNASLAVGERYKIVVE